MNDRTKNILIGLFVTGALATMVAFVLFLKPTVGDGKKTLNVRFANIAGISVGTRVTWAGKPIGEVTHIQELPNARLEADEHGRIYLYQLTLKIDSSTNVYNCDEIAIRTTGLMGEKSIAILPKLPPKNKTETLINDQIAYANSTDPLENTFNQISKVASRLESTVTHLDKWFEDNQHSVANAVRSFDGAMGQVDAILNVVGNEKLIPALRQSTNLLNNNLELIHSSLEDEQLLHKISNLATDLNETANHLNTNGAQLLSHLNQISRDIAMGSGTVGRLISGDDLYLRVASLMNKGETLMNDINHYGILFQYNKQWQKTRTKRAAILNSIDTAQDFRNYFEGEVDSMTTSLGRLTQLMEQTDRKTITQSDIFKRDFAALLRQVQGLADSLKLYNEGLVAESEIK